MTTEILLVSAGMVHPSLPARFWLHRALKALPDFRFQRASSLESLTRHPLERFQGLVLYFHHETISGAALDALDNFVQQGGGVLAVHSATASFKAEDRYYEILGGQFTTHGPIQSFEVLPASGPDEIYGQIPAFEVRDELYLHEYDLANRVHFYTEVEGEQAPIVWTRGYGQGRVSYCALGHCISTVRHPAMQQIVQRGLAWACGERVPW